MRTQNILLMSLFISLYGCQPEAPTPKAAAPAAAESSALPAQAAQPLASEAAAPVQQIEPVYAEKAAQTTEKVAAVVKEKAPQPAVAEKPAPTPVAKAEPAPVAAEASLRRNPNRRYPKRMPCNWPKRTVASPAMPSTRNWSAHPSRMWRPNIAAMRAPKPGWPTRSPRVAAACGARWRCRPTRKSAKRIAGFWRNMSCL